MVRSRTLALVIVALCGAAVLAGENVGVPGSNTQYPTTLDSKVGDKTVRLVLTGTAMRKKVIFNVYAVASYVQQGVKVQNADDLAAVDAPKQLYLVMERDLDGKTMANAFREAVRMNYAAPAYDAELNKLANFLEATAVKRGDHVLLTHIPGVGFQGRLNETREILIPNPRFSRAIWDAYLGKSNVGEAVKRGLTSRL